MRRHGMLCISLSLLVLFSLMKRVSSYCNVLDHQACDELCKVDNFWYGHCTEWDGKNFSCKCFEYLPPLDGSICTGKHAHCSRKCQETEIRPPVDAADAVQFMKKVNRNFDIAPHDKGSEGGFCYPQRDRGMERRRTGCECFRDVPPLLRRRKRSYNHVIKTRQLS